MKIGDFMGSRASEWDMNGDTYTSCESNVAMENPLQMKVWIGNHRTQRVIFPEGTLPKFDMKPEHRDPKDGVLILNAGLGRFHVEFGFIYQKKKPGRVHDFAWFSKKDWNGVSKNKLDKGQAKRRNLSVYQQKAVFFTKNEQFSRGKALSQRTLNTLLWRNVASWKIHALNAGF